jgi:NAD-dependent dihydropyrimidine dehydrogenase PreA subunit
VNRIFGFIMGLLFRWFPFRAPTGLRAVGSPDSDSPVLVTTNYTLTLARLLKQIRGMNVWLLVADSGGINVWCASCAGTFTERNIIDEIKESRLATRVNHHELVLPALAASGVDRKMIKEETGFDSLFGPVRAKDVPRFIASEEKEETMMRADFSYRHRLDMLISMNFVMWLPVAILFAIFWRESLLHVTLLFWGMAVFSYLVCPWNPKSSGFQRAATMAVLLTVGYGLAGWLMHSDVLANWRWMLGGVGLVGAICFDMAGIVSPVKSDAEEFLQKQGVRKLGFLMTEKEIGRIALDVEKCIGCFDCYEICPVGVFDTDEDNEIVVVARPDDCFACGACVKQCPTDALALK